MIEKLNWDSDFFGYEIGKIVILNESKFDYNLFKVLCVKYKLIYIYSQTKLSLNNGNLVDEKVTLQQSDISKYEFSSRQYSDITVFNSQNDNLKDLIKLTIESGMFSRFNKDVNIAKSDFENLYKEWILNSVNHKLAFVVFVAKNRENKIVGFITVGEVNNEVSEIGLIAVDKGERGKGIAKALIEKAIKESIKRGYKKMEVVTQKENIPAMSLYSRTNFIEKETIYIYHYWNL